jgi:mitochondrial enoyl-[acyl-carrier protein] reductase / trans-2-enoyl-CoA reductase
LHREPIRPRLSATQQQGYYPCSNLASRALGVEALGIVEASGASVSDLSRGDRVILLTGDNWIERKVVKARDLVRVSATLDPLRLASLKVNPATAYLLLTEFAELSPGGWLIQNAADSGVGRAVIQIAHNRGLRSLKLVRRADLIPQLKDLAADAVLIDGDDLPERANEAGRRRGNPARTIRHRRQRSPSLLSVHGGHCRPLRGSRQDWRHGVR